MYRFLHRIRLSFLAAWAGASLLICLPLSLLFKGSADEDVDAINQAQQEGQHHLEIQADVLLPLKGEKEGDLQPKPRGVEDNCSLQPVNPSREDNGTLPPTRADKSDLQPIIRAEDDGLGNCLGDEEEGNLLPPQNIEDGVFPSALDEGMKGGSSDAVQDRGVDDTGGSGDEHISKQVASTAGSPRNAVDMAPEHPISTHEDESSVTLEIIDAALKSVLQHTKSNEMKLTDASSSAAMGTMQRIFQTVRQYRGDDTDLTLARQLHQLYSAYFTHRPDVYKFNSRQIINALAHKADHVALGRLWPDGSWVSRHKPKPQWLSQSSISSVYGINALEYKHALRELGYGPMPAPTADSLHEIWQALYNPEAAAASQLRIQSNAERYAVVSYVQRADHHGHEPPVTWAGEVDSVLTALTEMNVISHKAVWFDKLASRQYQDSQQWWGAAATMQFLFNPVIVLLPRISEHASFVRPEVGWSIWGFDEADQCYQSFLEHAKHCAQCLDSSYPLRWALLRPDADFVLPISALRTWPRVEHALGASGLGLFTSEMTYTALAATLTCSYAMFAALCKSNRLFYNELRATGFLPSTHIGEDESIRIAWVHISSSDWPAAGQDQKLGPGLIEMASCVMELHQLFCKLQTPKQLAAQRTKAQGVAPPRLGSQFQHQRPELRLLESGYFYPIKMLQSGGGGQEEIDVPTLARYSANDTFQIHGDSSWMTASAFATVQVFWAVTNIRRNLETTVRGEKQSVSNAQFLVARRQALTTLVHTKAAQAPCYAWEDKVVAAILLSSPRVFLDAFRFWEDKKQGGHMLGDVTRGLASAGVLEETEEVDWEPNTLIVALGMQWNQTVHHVVPRPEVSSRYQPIHCKEFERSSVDLGGGILKGFAGYFLGHLPLRAVNALPFRTKRGQKLPHVTDWVYRQLQHVALCDSNIMVVRQEWKGSPEQQAGQCWHCQRLLQAGLETPGSMQEPKLLLLPPYHMTDGRWGLGSFDPVNIAALLDPNYYFGLAPDSVAVLLDHHTLSHDKPSTLHAYALVHFSILGSARVRACNTCFAIIIEEWERRSIAAPANANLQRIAGNDLMLHALWTILPMDHTQMIDHLTGALLSKQAS